MSHDFSCTLPDWQNPQMLSRRREPPAASSVSFAGAETALAGERVASPWLRLLSPTALRADPEGISHDPELWATGLLVPAQ